MDARTGQVNICMSWQFDAPDRPALANLGHGWRGSSVPFLFESFRVLPLTLTSAPSTCSEYYAN